MSYFSISNLNGLGLLGQTISKISEVDINNPTKSLDEYIQNRKDDIEIVQKKEEGLDGNSSKFKNNYTKYELFLEKVTNIDEKLLSQINNSQYNELKQKIGIIEKALYVLNEQYNVNYNEFMDTIQKLDIEKDEDVIKIYSKHLSIIEYIYFIERIQNKEIVKPL